MSDHLDWKKQLRLLHLEWIKKKSPGFFNASGAYNMKVRPYTDQTTNGLTKCVLDFLNHKGHYAIRTNNQGQARISKIPIGGTQKDISGKGVKTYDKVTYTKNPDGRGKADIQASIKGKFISIEIKCKATKDRITDEQIIHSFRVEDSGGIYIIITEFPDMLNWYNLNINKL